MFSIGDFARLGGVSVRTLRYYEEVDLLAPAAVDPSTGYRSYTAGQLPRLHRIVALKELGLSLSELRPLLDELDAARLEGLLVEKRAELADRVATERARLERVERRLRSIQREGHVPTDVLLKQIPSLRVAAVRATATSPTFDDVRPIAEPALYALFEAITAAGVKPNGSLFVFYEHDGERLAPVAAVDIGEQPLPEGTIEVRLPAIDAATTVYEGPVDHSIVGPIYGEMVRWGEDHGYVTAGAGRDVLVSPPDEHGNAVFELQLPLRKA
jgi:DNA-binding transcriptional MerR regulator